MCRGTTANPLRSIRIKQPLIEQNLEQVSASVNNKTAAFLLGILDLLLCDFVPAVTNAENRKKNGSGMHAQFICCIRFLELR